MTILPVGNGAVPPAAGHAKPPQPTKPQQAAQLQVGHASGGSSHTAGAADGDGDHGMEPAATHGVNVTG